MHLSNMLKRSACAVVSAALLFGSLLLSGCSTPKVVAKVDNVEYSTADYLAYLYFAYQQTFYYNNLSQYSQYGMDPWSQKLTYGEGDAAESVTVEEYIKRLTKDTMIRQVAIQKMIDENGITYSDSDSSTVDKTLSSLTADEYIKLGFNNDTYGKMYKAVSLNESTLFYGLYDNNGSRVMSDDEIKDYYKNNILTYKIIEVSLTDSSTGADLSDDEISGKKADLQKYLDIYKQTGNFDSAISAATTTTTAAATDATNSDGADTTVNTTTTTTAAATTTTDSSTTTTTADGSSSTANTDSNLKYADANTYGDEDFTNAVKSVPIGDAQIVTYKKSGTTNTMALIYRIDPETTKYTLSESRRSVIYGAKYTDFDTEVKSYAATLTNDFSNSFIKNISVKDFVANAPSSSES